VEMLTYAALTVASAYLNISPQAARSLSRRARVAALSFGDGKPLVSV